MNYQTDFTGYVRDDGCLCFCHVNMAEEKVGLGLTHLQLSDLIYTLQHDISCSYDNHRPVLSDEDDINRPGIFVWDHEAVINNALLFMDITNLKAKYTGRIYLPWEEVRGKVSFGTRANADAVIIQSRTVNGGHFERSGYNPWEPGTKMIDIKSLRYYRWI